MYTRRGPGRMVLPSHHWRHRTRWGDDLKPLRTVVPRTARIGVLCLLAAAVTWSCGEDHGKRVDLATRATLYPRFTHEAVLLDDGRILVFGGSTGSVNNSFIAPYPIGLVQIYEPGTDTWRVVEPLEGPGLGYSGIKLSDGRVLFVGLEGADEDESGIMAALLDPTATAAMFDPAFESWAPLPGPPQPRSSPNLVLLDDGRVLAAGGGYFRDSESYKVADTVDTVEIFDPATRRWRQAASMNRVPEEQWLFPLDDGRLLAIGVLREGASDAAAHAEIYDPVVDEWTLVGSIDPYYLPTDAVQLSDGRVLVLGQLSLSYRSMTTTRGGEVVRVELRDGRRLSADELARQFPPAKIYDPASDVWSPTYGMAHYRYDASLTVLPSGHVLVAGGTVTGGVYGESVSLPGRTPPLQSEESGHPMLLSTTEIFDPSTNSWSPGPDLSEPRSDHSATLLPDGRVLLAGGVGIRPENGEIYPLASIEIVEAAIPPATATAPAVSRPPWANGLASHGEF